MSRKDFSLAEFISVNEEINPLREEIGKLEDQINELTNGEFYGKFRRGLETYRLREFERLWKKYPGARELFKVCIEKHKQLYEKVYGVPITDGSLRRVESVQNILKLYERFCVKFSLADWIGRG